jgi:hypothetical protein
MLALRLSDLGGANTGDQSPRWSTASCDLIERSTGPILRTVRGERDGYHDPCDDFAYMSFISTGLKHKCNLVPRSRLAAESREETLGHIVDSIERTLCTLVTPVLNLLGSSQDEFIENPEYDWTTE